MGLIGDDRLINRCDEDNRQTFPLFHLLAKNLLTKKKQVLTRREPSVMLIPPVKKQGSALVRTHPITHSANAALQEK